jgi:putative ABC transport system ATP-binding protein
VLQLRELKKSYVEPTGGILPVLDISTFDVAAGEQLALVGRSGSGKSTLLHVIGGIARPDQGRVIIDGVDITRLSEPACDWFRARHVGYVFQTFNLLGGFSALENVCLGMKFSGGRTDRARAKELLDRVGLADRMSHKPNALSVGEQQRVALARALANRPRILLADEPTANVDVGNQRRIIELLRQNCESEGVALMIVTHATEVAAQFRRVVELDAINRAARSAAPVAAAS